MYALLTGYDSYVYNLNALLMFYTQKYIENRKGEVTSCHESMSALLTKKDIIII